jgi:alginate O-acetyltransferase complex protein AlgI
VSFNSIEYLAFLILVVIVYWQLRHRAQNVLILVASYVFYGFWNYRFLALILTSTVVDYFVAIGIGRTKSQPLRRVLVTTSIVMNLGLLGVFKYYGFFVESAESLLRSAGMEVNPFLLEVALPVGISFYTFQTMAYTIEVYKGNVKPRTNFVSFAVYVSFFPQLVAGPIERPDHLLPQIENPRPRPDIASIQSGVTLILYGLFKKVILADTAALLVSRTFGDPGAYAGVALLGGAIAFSIQIYGDFSGYTSIARGSARLFGIDLMRNFAQPYLSRSLTEFWRRWHISLSFWLRDYLYIPLGGSHWGAFRTYRNIMLTMVLGGLWHGASWTFVIWGAIHGTVLVAERALRGRPVRAMLGRPLAMSNIPYILFTFGVVTFAWVFFRADSVSTAFEILGRIGTAASGAIPVEMAILPVLALTTLTLDLVERRGITARTLVKAPVAAQGLAYGMVIVALFVFSGTQQVPFIYFQF